MTPQCSTKSACIARVKSIQNGHMNNNVKGKLKYFAHAVSQQIISLQRWSDIGYSFLIGGDGRVYEGRGWKRVGAHTGGYNSVGYGVSFIGTFTSAYPNQAMIATYERFQKVKWLYTIKAISHK